jgi:hypothetical protein
MAGEPRTLSRNSSHHGSEPQRQLDNSLSKSWLISMVSWRYREYADCLMPYRLVTGPR